MVPFQTDHEESLLHYLQNFQLGSFDDVYSHVICNRFLFAESVAHGFCCVAGVGIVCYDVSGAVLGADEWGTEVFSVYG